MLRTLAALMGPIFAKELIETARRKRYYFNRVLYCVALLVAMFIVWEDFAWRASRYTDQRFMAALAEAMFLAVGVVQYGAVFLFVPVFLCGVISGEREGGTLELLFTTHLADREIVLGKLGSRAAVMALLILCALPIFSLIMLFGGIAPGALWRTQAATLTAVVYVGAHAIYFSAIGKSTVGSLVRTYWWMAIWLLAVPLGITLVVASIARGGPPPAYLVAMLWINPPFQFATAVVQELYNTVTQAGGSWGFAASFVFPLLWSTLLIWRAIVRLRLPPSALSDRIPLLAALRRAWRDRKLARAQRTGRRAERTWYRVTVHNPLWLRSRLARVYDREGHLGRIQWGGYAVSLAFIILVLLAEPRQLRDEEASMSFLAITWICTAALTTIVASTSLVDDRRRGFFELVLATPLRPQEVVGGTMLAVGQHLRPVVGLALVLGLFFWVTGASPLLGVMCSLITGALYCAVLVAMGTMCSLAARSAPQALVPTFMLSVVMGIVLLVLAAIFEDGAGPAIWFGGSVLLLCTWWWSRRSVSAAAVGTHFLAVHLALVGLATCWTYDGRHEEFPAVAMNPAFWAVAPLDGGVQHSYRQVTDSSGSIRLVPYRPQRANPRWYDGAGRWYWALVRYWAALLLNLWWARRWMIRRFDALAGRTLRGPDQRIGAPPV